MTLHARMSAEARARLEIDAKEIVARYPQSRSALLPMLHLVQSEQGYVSAEGIELCAEVLGLTTAQVAAVATFYTMYKRHPVGTYHVGVCTNTLCAIMGGDAIFATLKEHLGVGHDETTPDGAITLEHLECNAACDYAPVVMVNWEFFDDQTPDTARALVDDLRAGRPPRPTRGASLGTFKEISRVLAGFYDGRADEGVAAGPASLAGLELARQRGETAPESPREQERRRSAGAAGGSRPVGGSRSSGSAGSGLATGYGVPGGPSGSDAGVQTAESDPDHPAQPGEGAADAAGRPQRDPGGRP